tara:strand:+ start:335 stop:778 length:444 start_codon:yes stop_codon:yes gene_type:complete
VLLLRITKGEKHMKKLIIIITLLITTLTAQAHEFTVSDQGIALKSYDFHGKKDILGMDEGTLYITIANTTDAEIIAWSGTFICDNALGDQVITVGLKDENANLSVDGENAGSFVKSAFMDDSWSTIATGDSENYNCRLTSIRTAKQN